jgi:hypothetical protein
MLAFAISLAPRIVIIFAWLFSDRWSAVWDTWIWPTLGFIFLPYTTIMYVLSWNAVTGVSGWDWMWIGLGFLLDIMKWAQIANNRREIPYYAESYP